MPQFSTQGFPRYRNAHDFADSPVINAWGVFFGLLWAKDPSIYYTASGKLARYPYGETRLERDPFCFSGDQLAMQVFAEWSRHGKSRYAPTWFAPNVTDEVTGGPKRPDFMQPSMRGHLKRCFGQTASAFEDWYLMRSFEVTGKLNPMGEQNQMQVMAIRAGDDFIRHYVRSNRYWAEATLKYFSDPDSVEWLEREGTFAKAYDRGEPELARRIIEYIRGRL